MSLENLLADVFSGNFKNAEKRVADWWSTLTPAIKTFVTTIESDEGKILQGLVTTAAQDVIAGGLTTASFVSAAKDVGSKLATQNITMAQTTIFAALNAEVSGSTAASGATVPTNAGTGVVVPPVTAAPTT